MSMPSFAPSVPPLGPEETLAAITDYATRTGETSFVVKVSRAPNIGARYTHMATFEDAALSHFTSAERWLAAILGGGEYQLAVYSKSGAGTQKIGGFLKYSVQPAVAVPLEAVNRNVFRDPSYDGPSTISYPPASAQTETFVTPNGLTASVRPGALPTVPIGAVTGVDSLASARIEMERERVHRLEMEKLLAQQEARTRELLAATQKPTNLVEVVAALGPIFQSMMTERDKREERAREEQNRRDERERAAAIERDERFRREAEARERERREYEERRDRERREEIARREALQQEQMKMLLAIATKEDTSIPTVIELTKQHTATLSDMAQRSIDSMSTFSKMATSMIETVADLRLGEAPEGNPIVDGVKEVIKAVGAMTASHSKSVEKAVKTAPPQLPAKPNTPTPTPTPKPNMPPASEAPRQQQAFDGYNGEKQSTLDVVEAMIRDHADPAAVVDVVLDAFRRQDPELIAEFAKFDGDPEQLIVARLKGWALVPENIDYLEKLGEAMGEGAARLEAEQAEQAKAEQ